MIVLLLVLLLSIACRDQEPAIETHRNADQADKKIWIQGPAGRLFVDYGGAKVSTSGWPVVIVHSLAGNTTQWRAQLEHLRENRVAVAFDMRGHGQSEAARDGDYTLAAMARDLGAVVDSLGVRKLVLVGHSYGGGVIATYAGRHPDRVAGVLFVDAIGDARQFPAAEIEDWLSALRSEKYAEAIVAHWRTILTNADSAVTAAVLAALRQTPQPAVLGAVGDMFVFAPAAVMHTYSGPMQAIVSGLPDDPSALHHALPGLPHVAMPGTSHWLQMDRPEEFNQLMDEFLARVDSL